MLPTGCNDNLKNIVVKKPIAMQSVFLMSDIL